MKNPKIGNRFYSEVYDLNGTIKAVKNSWIRIQYDDWSHGDFSTNEFYKLHISLD